MLSVYVPRCVSTQSPHRYDLLVLSEIISKMVRYTVAHHYECSRLSLVDSAPQPISAGGSLQQCRPRLAAECAIHK